jgi:hypothetical protein
MEKYESVIKNFKSVKYQSKTISNHYLRLQKFIYGRYSRINSIVECYYIDTGNFLYATLFLTILDGRILNENSYIVINGCYVSMNDFVRISGRYLEEEREIVENIDKKGLILMSRIMGTEAKEQVEKQRLLIYALIMYNLLVHEHMIEKVLPNHITIRSKYLIPDLCTMKQIAIRQYLPYDLLNLCLINFVCPCFRYTKEGFFTNNRDMISLYPDIPLSSINYDNISLHIALQEKSLPLDGMGMKILFDYLYGYYVLIYKLHLLPDVSKTTYEFIRFPYTSAYIINNNTYKFSTKFAGILIPEVRILKDIPRYDIEAYIRDEYREFIADNYQFLEVSIERLWDFAMNVAMTKAVNSLIELAKKNKVENTLNVFKKSLHNAFLHKCDFTRDFMGCVYKADKTIDKKMSIDTTFCFENKFSYMSINELF